MVLSSSKRLLIEVKMEKEMILSIFRRKGGEGTYTKIVSDKIKNRAFSHINIDIDGEPIIYSENNGVISYILTNKYIIYTMDNIRIPLSNIKSISLDRQKEMRELKIGVNQFRFLKIDTDDQNYYLEVETGPSFSGIWNALRYIARQNQKI